MVNSLATISSALSSFLYALEAIAVLLFMVTIHEFGHYVAGKKLGFKINEFAIGFGPAIFKRNMKSGELFSVRALPLGGYCAFEGEDEESDSDKAFEKQASWKRMIVLLAGAFMNFFVTVLIVILTYSVSGQYVFSVGKVLPNDVGETTSQEYILQENDIILAVNGYEIYMPSELTNALSIASKTPDVPISIEIVRNGERMTVEAKIRDYVLSYTDDDGNDVETHATGLGILQSSSLYKFGFFESVKRANVYCFKMAGEVLSVIGQLFTGKLSLDSLSGPVSTITITAEIASYGFRQLLEIITLIGVNLAVFNLLPIPALDGCKVLFTVIEWIRGKAIDKKIEGIVNFAGFVFLIGFAILVDLIKVI